ncbi:hypothetical protein BDF19DRAFT_462663 [Syncephalis fuscata]|nr:hypothetical protein BDF19DRAFT_462663 [Syncephalis fuscata]
MLSIVLNKHGARQMVSTVLRCRAYPTRPPINCLMPYRVGAAGLHHVSCRRTGMSVDEARKDLRHHREEAYAKAETFSDKAHALRNSMQQKLPMASPANKHLASNLIDNYIRSILALQDRVEQHARHVDEEITMVDAQISDDIVQELDDVRSADRRLNDVLVEANRMLDDLTHQLQHRLQKTTSGSGLLVDDVELGRQDWHLHNLKTSANSSKNGSMATGQHQQSATNTHGHMNNTAQEIVRQVGDRSRREVADNFSHPNRQYARGMYDDVADAMENINHKASRATFAVNDAVQNAGEMASKTGRQAANSIKSQAGDMANRMKEGQEDMMQHVKDQARKQADKAASAIDSMSGDKMKQTLQDAGSTIKQKAHDAYDTITKEMPANSKKVFEEKMGIAYDTLKDGMDMTGLAQAQSKITDQAHQIKDQIKEQADKAASTLSGMSGNKMKQTLQDAGSTIKQKAHDAYDAAAKEMPANSKKVFEEKMGIAYDTLKDGMDMTGLAQAQSKIADQAHQAKDQVKKKVKQAASTLDSMSGDKAKQTLQDAGSTIKQKAHDVYDAVAKEMPSDSAKIFEEKMGTAYDTLKDGMDMTGLAQAQSKIVNKVKDTMATASSNKPLHGVAAYDMIEHMEEVEDHPAELDQLREAEIKMYGNDRKLREAVFTWSEDAAMQAMDDRAVPKYHDIRTAVGSTQPKPSSMGSKKERIDDDTLNALLDEAEDFGAVIREDPRDMLRRRSNLRS